MNQHKYRRIPEEPNETKRTAGWARFVLIAALGLKKTNQTGTDKCCKNASCRVHSKCVEEGVNDVSVYKTDDHH